MKLAFIVQRYGREILGGSETLARQLAERLSRRHDITVLTSTAKDYITWKNEYPPGEDKVRGVHVVRFPVEGERNLEDFNRFSEEIYKGQPTREQELEWLKRQGPIVPDLIDYLKREQESFDLLVFFTYLYYPTYYGLQVAPEKSVLVPTAHDEPPLKLGIFREMFQLPSSFLFNTEAEELLVLERFPVHKKMRETIGIGMELLDQPDVHAFRRKHDIPGKYLLYAGRIDAGKGLEELFRFFDFYKEEHPGSGNLQLILIGKLSMKLPANPSIRYIGFVDEGDKLSAMAGAVAVVQPSRMESLSIVALEAFSVSTPVIVSAASRVLTDHCRRANAGLYYGDFEEFEEILTLLLSDRNLARILGRNGQTYVKENFGWNRLLSKYELVFRSSARPSKEPRGARARPLAPAPAPREAPPEVESSAPEEAGPAHPEPSPAPLPPDLHVETGEPSYSEPESAFSSDEMEERASPEPKPDAPPEDAEARAEDDGRGERESETDEEEVVDEDLAPLPSFYRSSVPPRAVGQKTPPPPPEEKSAPAPAPEPAARAPEPPETEEAKRPEEAKPEESEATAKGADEEASSEKGEGEREGENEEESRLPAFYRPRPRPSDETEGA